MDDATYSFKEDIKERKSMISGSRHKKNGSKSKSCKLPYEHLSYSQRKQLNGEVKSYSMNRPMTWKEFKQMPSDLQETYLATLVDAFHVGSVQIGSMMGVCNTSINRLIKEKGFTKVHNKKGVRKYTEEDIQAWNEFLGEWPSGKIVKNPKDSLESAESTDSATSISEDMKSLDNTTPESTVDTDSVMKLSNFHIGYDGTIDLKEVVEYLQLILGESFNGHLEISFTK